MAKPSTQPSNQKNLFSFFSKKSKPTVAPRDRVAPVINNPPLQTRIQVYWPKDDEWYACVLSKQLNDGRVKLVYEDGEVEVVRLEKEKWRLADAANDANANNEEDNDDDESKAADANESNKRENTDQATTSKRRRIHESSDESFAMDEDDEDDSFQCDVDDSDDESFKEEEPSKPKPKVTLLTPKPSASSQQPKRIISSTPHKPPRPTPANLPSKQLSASLISNNSPSLPIANIVNLPQTHFHNHLTFFSDRIDLSGHPASSPHHSPYNMKIDWDELTSLSSSLGTSLSPAQKQWWDIKSHYANCVLLFKTGKFYEMFHDDADVAVKELNFVYMKGVLAHAGFPEGAYDKIVGTLVERGYRVARVEQTETPEMLKERKRGMKGGKKPMVVCREVCGVVSLGTR
jgi:DNA mismatch repair protein MSH6